MEYNNFNYNLQTQKTWEQYNFPLIKSTWGKWERRNQTLSNLKHMFKEAGLKFNEDYMFAYDDNAYPSDRHLTVRFREAGEGLIFLLKWTGKQ